MLLSFLLSILEGIQEFVGLKRKRADLKVSFAIGGWNEGSTKYSTMASTAAGRDAFASSVAALIKQHGFDGVDLDWEYPGTRGGKPVDKANFVLLLQVSTTEKRFFFIFN